MIVVDASAVVDAVVHERPDPALTEHLRADGQLHAPHLIDAVYIALSELLEAPLVTCDARMARASGHEAEIELFAPS